MTAMYLERRPSPALARSVRTIWIQSTGDAAYRQRDLPTGGVEIRVPLGGPAELLGPLTGHRVEYVPGSTTIVGVRFLPGAAPPLRVPLDELVDRRIPLADLWGAGADRLADEMADAPDADGAVEALELFLLQWFRASGGADPLMRDAVTALMPWRPAEVGAVAARLGVSESQLRRRSLRAVGLSPKVLQRTLRFQGFLALAQAGAEPSGRRGADGLAGLAADAGYADQAHLSRECQRISGLTPRQLLHGDIGRCACGHDHSASYLPFLAGRPLGASARLHPLG